MKTYVKLLAGAGVALGLGAAYAAAALTVDRSLTADDLRAIAQLGVDGECAAAQSGFEAQIDCIAAIQSSVLAIGATDCAPKGTSIEPLDFITRGYGCCYDRARFIEKAARHYGFETRHLFLIDEGAHIVLSLATPGVPSHAASEILTARGWVGVDSIEPLMLVDADGRPWTYADAIQAGAFADHDHKSLLYGHDWRIIVGLYSRHGRFHGPDLPGPEFDLAELTQNF